MIFTSNDIIINIGVIAAGALTLLTHSSYPDLIIGMIVFVIVLFGARNIFKIGKIIHITSKGVFMQISVKATYICGSTSKGTFIF